MKVCVITGSSGLIGSEMSRELLARGYKVYGFDLKSNPRLDHPDFIFVKCDISKESEIQKAFRKLSSLDVLINNGASSHPQNKKIQNLDLKTWNEIISINLTSVFLMTKYAIPLLKKSKGNIINISSTRHLISEPDTEIYSAAKGGLDALTRSLAISLGPDIRVNSISPGWIADPKTKVSSKAKAHHPVGRIGRPEDIAKCVAYLSSDEAGFITGSDFVIDGGICAKMLYLE